MKKNQLILALVAEVKAVLVVEQSKLKFKILSP